MTADRHSRSLAAAYDAEYAVIRDASGDREFYADLARRSGGPVLEIGCGTGRVLLPIARDGIECVGVDPSDAMLDVLRAKGPPPNATIVRGSATGADVGERRFRLVFAAFRVFQHLLTVEDQLAALAFVRGHLAPGGVFAFDVFAPDMARLALTEEPEQEDVRTTDGTDEVLRSHWIERDLAAQVQRVWFRHRRVRDGVTVADDVSHISMRWFHRFELEHLLARSGFAIQAVHGSFDRRPYDASGDIVVVARAAGARAADRFTA